jgi:hypothetical protein
MSISRRDALAGYEALYSLRRSDKFAATYVAMNRNSSTSRMTEAREPLQ